MRSAVVAFAFEHLRAERITSDAFLDNLASQRVSQATGYEANGTNTVVRRGVAAEQLRSVLTKQSWETKEERAHITVEGLEPCSDLFGLGDDPTTV